MTELTFHKGGFRQRKPEEKNENGRYEDGNDQYKKIANFERKNEEFHQELGIFSKQLQKNAQIFKRVNHCSLKRV